MDKEIWKDIPNYEGIYQVSNLGNVKNKTKNRKLHLRKDGYLDIPLCKNGKTKYYLVHRLVAMAFINNPNNYKEVNHKDENKQNNNVNNLEWCDRLYNIKYGNGYITRAEKRKRKIRQYDKNYNFIKQWDSVNEVSKILNIKAPHITRVCKKERKTTGGYIFEYCKEV